MSHPDSGMEPVGAVSGLEQPVASRPGHAPRRGFADFCAVIAGLGLGGTLGLVVTGEHGVR